MDVVQAKTFMAVVETGSFVDAAKRVFVTQSTVSMRIKALEEQLGKVLFERSKAGATLTPAGAQFQKHALAIMRIWEQARLEVSLPEGYQASLTVGGQYSLWDGFLLEWLSRLRAKSPEIAVRSEIGFSNGLMHRLLDGTVNLAVMYTPQARPGFEVEHLFEEELLMVTSDPDMTVGPGKSYIFVDWGPEFQADHSLNFPDLSTPGVYLQLGSLGLKYLLENHATGYFPSRIVAPHLETGDLRLVPSAPTFSYPAYAVYPEEANPQIYGVALEALRETVGAVTGKEIYGVMLDASKETPGGQKD